MKRYMFVLLVLGLACAFSMSVAAAEDLQKYDFDGKFTMELEKGLDFERNTTNGGYVIFTDASKGYTIMYVENSFLKPEYVDQFYEGFESGGFEVVGAAGSYIKIHEKDGLYVASEYKKSGIVVFSMNTDKEKALDSIRTVEYK